MIEKKPPLNPLSFAPLSPEDNSEIVSEEIIPAEAESEEEDIESTTGY